MLKTRFLAEGGKESGYGHLSRCKALFDGFIQAGADARMVVRGDDTVSAMLDHSTYEVYDWMGEPSPECDILVLDSYLPTSDDCKRLSQKARLAVFFDDTNRIPYPPGVVINGAIDAVKLNYSAIQGVKYLLGPKYQLVRSEFLCPRDEKSSFSSGSVLVTFGGNDLRGMTPVVLKVLTDNFPELKKVIVIGNSYDAGLKPEAYADNKTTFIHAPAAKEWARLMRQADFAICAGGQTLFELAASGTPAVVIGIAENQKGNIAGWSNAGFISFGGWYNAPGLVAGLINAIRKILSPGSLEIMRRKASGIINPVAALDLAGDFVSMLQHGRL